MTFRLNAAQRWLRLTLIGLSFISTPSLADEAPRARNLQPARYVEVSVEEAYLEVHTGPGRGYPVTRVIAR